MPCTPRTPATVWESHKEEIRQLYLAEDKGLPSVMEHMKTSYGLAASKNEYQRIFNQWGFRKNLTQKEWAFVNHRTQKRKAEDATKETQVTFHGVRQDPKRVKRELNRHFPWPEQQPTGVPSPKTPAGILVGTPAALIGTPAELVSTPGTPAELVGSPAKYVGISLSPVSPTELISIWDNGGGTNSPNVSPVSPTELISIWDNGGGTNSPNVIDAVVKKDDFWYPFDVYQEPEIQLSNEIKPLRWSIDIYLNLFVRELHCAKKQSQFSRLLESLDLPTSQMLTNTLQVWGLDIYLSMVRSANERSNIMIRNVQTSLNVLDLLKDWLAIHPSFDMNSIHPSFEKKSIHPSFDRKSIHPSFDMKYGRQPQIWRNPPYSRDWEVCKQCARCRLPRRLVWSCRAAASFEMPVASAIGLELERIEMRWRQQT